MNSYQNTAATKRRFRTESIYPGLGEEIYIDDMVFSLLEEQKRLDAKFLYDTTGTRLLQEICLLRDYYPSRTALHVLKNVVIPSLPSYKELEIITIGPGDNLKAKHLIMSLHHRSCRHIRYIPVDFSEAAMQISVQPVKDMFNDIEIAPIHTDLSEPLVLPEAIMPRLFYVFGSSPGQPGDHETLPLLKSLKANMTRDDLLLVGFDRIKPVHILEKAYNDVKGLVAAFNKNVLSVVNRVAAAGIDQSQFIHQAFFNSKYSRIELHLKALTDLNLHLRKAGLILGMCSGESILTATAKKYSRNDIEQTAAKAGLTMDNLFSDEKKWYSIAGLKVE
ncbi:MAG TPA: L-histidine N(alpha)-methyltransferase [Bacteroidales bacterium]|nr:L-histidine N(alpha)-methyltransferase [Bacteroidales bacterium]